MMRKGMMFGALLLAAAMQAETVIVKQAVPQKWLMGGWAIKQIQKSETVTKDKASFNVIKIEPNAKVELNSYQAWCGVTTALTKGAKYRVSYTLTASGDCALTAGIFMMGKPWTAFAPAKKLNLKKGQPQKITVDFTAAKDYKGTIRVPGLSLGNLKAGQSVAISDLSFVKLD